MNFAYEGHQYNDAPPSFLKNLVKPPNPLKIAKTPMNTGDKSFQNLA
jgi:hypothetical protein